MNRPQPLRVCLVALKCFDHMVGNAVPRYLGGIETQLAVLAQGLTEEGCRVSMITYDHGQAGEFETKGVKMLKCYRPSGGVKVLRNFHPRMTGLVAAMRRADAHVYLQMGAGAETGQVALGCQVLRGPTRKFTFCLASDADCKGPLHAGLLGWEHQLYRYGLRRADLVVSQTSSQQRNLQRILGVQSRVVPMAVRTTAKRHSHESREHSTPRVLWIGRITPEKRLEWLLEMARRCPDSGFDIVGTPNQPSSYARDLMEEGACLANVTIHGRLPLPELDELYRRASVLCCTSKVEGFPTTFLEAWSRGIPVVTTFDPDQVVARQELGRVASNEEELMMQLRSVLGDGLLRARLSESAHRYFEENHSPQVVARQFRLALEGCWDSQSVAMQTARAVS